MAEKTSDLTLTRTPTGPNALVNKAMDRLETEVGGRPGLVAALAFVPRHKDLELLLGLLGDPAYAKDSLADLCKMAKLSLGDVWSLWRTGETARAAALATRSIGTHLPNVVEDVMKRAAPYEDDCETCGGLKFVTPDPTKDNPNPVALPCETCNGTGRLRYTPELDRQVVALKLGGLLKDGGGVVVNNMAAIQNNLNLNDGAGALEKLSEATDQILYGDVATGVEQTEFVEAEVEPDATQSGAPSV